MRKKDDSKTVKQIKLGKSNHLENVIVHHEDEHDVAVFHEDEVERLAMGPIRKRQETN